MNLDLSKIFQRGTNVYDFEDTIVEHDLNQRIKQGSIDDAVVYTGQIYSAIDGLFLDAKIKYFYKTECSRCLKNINKENTISLSGKLEDYEETFKKEEFKEEDIDKEVTDEPIYYNNGFLELDEYVLMEIASSIPMKTLCSDDCKGLCMLCGVDHNKEDCNCDTDFIDPRLAKLKDFVIED